MEIRPGSIVYSKAGRDKGAKLLVIDTEGEYAYVADGEHRRIDKLKKKKFKHLQGTNHISDNIGENPTNSDVRKILAQY